VSGSGLALSADYYRQVVALLLSARWPGLPHAAARLGGGSEVLGLDDEQSRDHDWGLRLTLLVDLEMAEPVDRYLEQVLPERHAGWPVRFATSGDPRIRHRVEVDTVDGFAQARLGLDPTRAWAPADWLTLTGQAVLEVTAGAVFADTTGQLTALRDRLGWYPEDVWRFVVAADWARIGEELPLLGRTGHRGDDLGSRVILGRLVQAAVHLGFLLERSWPPYPKWAGVMFAALPSASAAAPALSSALQAEDWRTRQDSFCQALEVLHALQRSVGLPTSGDVVEPFHTRPYRTVHHDVTRQLIGSITDPEIRSLDAGIGCIEQLTDNVTVLTNPRLRSTTVASLEPADPHPGGH
jgi:hypothetical protein